MAHPHLRATWQKWMRCRHSPVPIDTAAVRNPPVIPLMVHSSGDVPSPVMGICTGSSNKNSSDGVQKALHVHGVCW